MPGELFNENIKIFPRLLYRWVKIKFQKLLQTDRATDLN